MENLEYYLKAFAIIKDALRAQGYSETEIQVYMLLDSAGITAIAIFIMLAAQIIYAMVKEKISEKEALDSGITASPLIHYVINQVTGEIVTTRLCEAPKIGEIIGSHKIEAAILYDGLVIYRATNPNSNGLRLMDSDLFNIARKDYEASKEYKDLLR